MWGHRLIIPLDPFPVPGLIPGIPHDQPVGHAFEPVGRKEHLGEYGWACIVFFEIFLLEADNLLPCMGGIGHDGVHKVIALKIILLDAAVLDCLTVIGRSGEGRGNGENEKVAEPGYKVVCLFIFLAAIIWGL